MGYRYETQIRHASATCFRAVEITGSVLIDQNRKIHFYQILLLHDDIDTLEFAEQNMARFVNNAMLLRKAGMPHDAKMPVEESLTDEIVSLFESIIMKPEKNMLQNLTAALKKAILSIALSRYNANKEMICNVLGLSGRQLDDEMQSSGFAVITDK